MFDLLLMLLTKLNKSRINSTFRYKKNANYHTTLLKIKLSARCKTYVRTNG